MRHITLLILLRTLKELRSKYFLLGMNYVDNMDEQTSPRKLVQPAFPLTPSHNSLRTTPHHPPTYTYLR